MNVGFGVREVAVRFLETCEVSGDIATRGELLGQSSEPKVNPP